MFCFYYSTNISPIFNTKNFLYDIHFIRDSTWLLFYSWIIVSFTLLFHHFDNFFVNWKYNWNRWLLLCKYILHTMKWMLHFNFSLKTIMIISIYNKIKWQTYIMDVQVEFGLWSVNSFINCQEVHHGILSRINCKLHVFSRLIRTISICWNVYLLKKKKWCIKTCIR